MTKVALAVVDPELNERIQKMESLVGKYDNVPLIDTDFIDSYQFPAMKRQFYIENYTTKGGEEEARLNLEFEGIQRSTILNLRNLLVFGTIGAVMQCTKFLLSRLQNGSLWLGWEILIHAEDIHRLMGLSAE